MAKIAKFGYMKLTTTWPKVPKNADKYARGVVGIMTGSERYPGAAVLSVLGAANSGAGFVRFCGADAAKPAIVSRVPSVTYGPGRVDSWVIGSGWDEEDRSGNLAQWQQALSTNVPIVADAGALFYAADGMPDGSLMTPHAGELARLLALTREEVVRAPSDYVGEAARLFRTTILLKGHNQYLSTPSGQVSQPLEGSPWLAQAGSGDVLAGIAGTVLAQLKDPELAGLLAASLQAWVSTQHPGPFPPDRMAEFLPKTLGSFVQFTN